MRAVIIVDFGDGEPGYERDDLDDLEGDLLSAVANAVDEDFPNHNATFGLEWS